MKKLIYHKQNRMNSNWSIFLKDIGWIYYSENWLKRIHNDLIKKLGKKFFKYNAIILTYK